MRDLNELQRLAEQGHDESQFLLGYNYSRGPNKDINQAKVWLERAAMANNPRAQYYLGELCAELGRSDPRGAYNHMAYWWGKSANHPYWETMEGMDGRAVSKRRLVWLHMHSGYENASAEVALNLLGELANKYSSPRSAIELGVVLAAGSFTPLSARLGNVPVKQDKENGFRLIERGLKVIENSSNDIDYNLYNIIADVYLSREGSAPRTAETINAGIYFKNKALERATGSNEGAAQNIRNEIAALENELHQVSGAPVSPQQEPATVAPPPTAISNELAEKFERFHAYFDTLTLEGKRDFITSLDQKLQANPNPDYQGFLLECVEKYRIANKESQTQDQEQNQPASMPPLGGASIGSQGHTGPFSTGAISDEDAHHRQAAFEQAYDDESNYQQAAYAPASESHFNPEGYDAPTNDEQVANDQHHQPHVGAYGSESYTDRIHTYGASTPFLFGAILYTLGGLVLPLSMWAFANHPLFEETSRRMIGYGLITVMTLLPILPILALWMIYSASKNPRAPEKSLTSLTLFRITFFAHLGVIMAGAAVLALLFGADGQALFGLSIFDSPLDLVLILGGLALIVLYVTFFYGSLFSMVKGIRDGIYSNMFDELPGVGPFSAINYITSILLILLALVIILVGVAPEGIIPFNIPVLDTFNEGAENWFGSSTTVALAVMAFAMILSRAGSLLCTNVVNQFNAGLIAEMEEELE